MGYGPDFSYIAAVQKYGLPGVPKKLQEQQEEAENQARLSNAISEQQLQESREANRIAEIALEESRKANRRAEWSMLIAIFCAIISLLPWLISLILTLF